MSTFKVQALYDFHGEPNTSEMSIIAGEIITVLRTNVGEGWWEGLKDNGETGLIPEAYVERIPAGSAPPSVPAPVLQPTDQWDDDDDDDWDEDNTYSEIGQRESVYANEPNQNTVRTSQNNQFDNVSEQNVAIDNKGTITKKSLNRFGTFVKSGLESYMSGAYKGHISPTSRVAILRDDLNDILGRWQPISNPYTVKITSPKKETKLGGLKSFIAYTLSPSFSSDEVTRRYKHFDWLHDRLTEKFNCIAIPPLPDKQVAGRYEEHFIEHRRAQLQEFVNYMCRHPVLSGCDVWHHFLTCKDDRQWKQGKRQAEKDGLIGANYCLCIEAPSRELMPNTVEKKIEESIVYVNRMDQSIKGVMATAMDQQKKYVNMYKREFSKIGESFLMLGAAMEANNNGMFSKSSVEVKSIGSMYISIGKLYEDQFKTDWQPLADKLYLYKGITTCFPDILGLQKSADQKKKEIDRTSQQPSLHTEVKRRADVLTYAVFAELDHFQQERDSNLREGMKGFLKEQLQFYKKIVEKIEVTLDQFE